MSKSGRRNVRLMVLLMVGACIGLGAEKTIADEKVGENCWSNQECTQEEYCLFDDCAAETGQCVLRPTGCPDVWDPVCGCDGNTYGNACEAAAAGVSVDFEGECVTRCWSNQECNPAEYCLFDDCSAETGQCSPRPQGCPEVLDPVCGCDGITYDNACFAAMAGVTVDYVGICLPSVCWSNQECDPTEYCLFESCAADTGECTARPDACPEILDPVCGCDGITYDNACFAAMAGVTVDYEGACLPDTCWSNADCPVAGYCLFADCAAETGQCVFRPTGCPDVWEPVCGCDRVTYGNACEAAAAGVTVDYEGECLPDECQGNNDCPLSEYCLFEDCYDETGFCMSRPTGCPDVWEPVCGCDGITYGNACEAAAAGATVAYEGECKVCWSNQECSEVQYCHFSECALETGICMLRPTECPYLWDPVCGCDGQTYANACVAAASGMTVDYEGACIGDTCHGNEDCSEAGYCLFEDCNAETGDCQLRPLGCPDVWDPVCGCDGVTYGNDCEVAAAGMSVAYEDFCIMGDFNLDGVVDILDYPGFESCITGPVYENVLDSYCARGDFDSDQDVDLRDFAVFQTLFTGSVPTAPVLISFSNSGCLQLPSSSTGGDEYPCPDDDEIFIQLDGDLLLIEHLNASYNCCLDDVEIEMSASGNSIEIQETEILTAPCYCICCYSVLSKVQVFGSGEYAIEYCWQEYDTGSTRCENQTFVVE